jgi:hypothetical protein
MTIAPSLATGTQIPIKAKLAWAACTATQCVPLHAVLTINLVVGDGVKSAEAAALASAAAKLPKAAPEGSFTAKGKLRRLVLPASIALDPARTRFFPTDNDSFVTAGAIVRREAGQLTITGHARSAAAAIGGVVTDGRSSYRITFEKAKAEAAAAAGAAATPDRAVEQATPLVEPAHHAPAIVSASHEEKRQDRGPWQAIAAALLVLGGATLLLGRRKRNQRPRI